MRKRLCESVRTQYKLGGDSALTGNQEKEANSLCAIVREIKRVCVRERECEREREREHQTEKPTGEF